MLRSRKFCEVRTAEAEYCTFIYKLSVLVMNLLGVIAYPNVRVNFSYE
jgi:hypothetical protein